VLSSRKRQLAIAERGALFAAAACLLVALSSSLEPTLSKVALPVVLFAIGTMFYLAFMIAGLEAELSRALGKYPSSDDEGYYTSMAEIRKQLQWAPKTYRVAALIAMAGMVGTALAFGAVSWTTDSAFTSRHAIGASLYLICILAIELPVIASASRMPGTFSDNISHLSERDT
jgi:uncharacterized membrane protein YeiB